MMNIEKEREEFEVWARKHGQPVFRDDEEPECYAYSNVQDNWSGWQARAALQPQGEAVAWLYEDELPGSYPYEVMFAYSKVDGVRMFPVYAPQTAESVKVPSDA